MEANLSFIELLPLVFTGWHLQSPERQNPLYPPPHHHNQNGGSEGGLF
jgi:hypothetical protein